MRMLVLGGTWLLGRYAAEGALARGWSVTCFNRGLTGEDVPGVRSVRGDRTSTADLSRLTEAGPWDVVVDTSAREPADVGRSARALRPCACRYVLMSTVSAYQGWPAAPVSEGSSLWPSSPTASRADPAIDAMSPTAGYGTLKAGCELVAQQVFGTDTLILRPGVILGPHEYVGRLPWLLLRAARGGAMLAAGGPDQPVQPIDVRDLATFLLRLASAEATGVHNTVAPPAHATYGELLRTCVEVTGGTADLVWIPSDWLTAQEVRQWTEIPLWRTAPGTWAVDGSSARAAGLECRPLRETVADTWTWLRTGHPTRHERQNEHGLAPDKETELLTRWRSFR
ncbi:NAD-dependent epimerase/dehydratase family protein [Longispora urticae]